MRILDHTIIGTERIVVFMSFNLREVPLCTCTCSVSLYVCCAYHVCVCVL